MKFGFPLDFDRSTTLKCDNKNHSSGIDFPHDVELYLKEETIFGAILGPFVNNPIPDCHKSPFMTRKKNNSLHRRVIVDLSWPTGASVNTGINSYLGTEFVLSLPSIDHIMSRIRALGPGAHLYRMLELLRSNYDVNLISLTGDFRRDLRWFSTFLSKYNGVSFYDHVKTHHLVELDACLSGLGGRWENLVYHLLLPHHCGNVGIAQLEMVNILVAIHIFASFCHRKSILIKFDNAATVSVLHTGKARDPFLAAVARNIWMELAKEDIQAVYRHIPGRVNQVADLVSRWRGTPAPDVILKNLVANPVWLPTHMRLLELNNDI